MKRLSSEHAASVHQRHHLHRAPGTRPPPIGLRPRRWQLWAVHGLTLALMLTGSGWLLAHFGLRSTGSFGEELPSPLEPWALRLHGVLAYAFMFVLGSMSTVHMVQAWRVRRHRLSGALLVGAAVLLAATALALYYAPEWAHASASLAHWLVGLALLPLLWAHVLLARRARARSPAH